ncbi:peptidylprolyl isomerase [Roseovarius spongiae]|uniref:Parvulin-like PPIase n=1 Tax=Roseovarius spongiae TaxID=2320272 RepID=A0A3A8B4L0_9RHOB|nr:peptidylprolyl isomerase [Roseovarius spongiae]RKF13447.1 peptidylprolyl isomerase [Roseovarius spongiae]
MFDRLKPIALSALIAIAPLAAGAADAEDAPDASTVVASVNGTDITLGHMIALRAGLPAQFAQVPPEVLYKGILDQLIQQTLLEQNMEGDLSLAGRLALDNERRAVAASQEIGRITESALSDAAIKAAFDAKYAEAPDVTEYSAAHILVETKEEAEKLIAELEDGADFAELAKEHSTGPSGPSGGALGWFSAGMMVEEFQDAVEGMEPGEVSDPVQTQFGWHVIKLNETRTKDRPELDDVRDEIEEQVRQDALNTYVEGLLEESEVDRETGDAIDPELLNQYELLED